MALRSREEATKEEELKMRNPEGLISNQWISEVQNSIHPSISLSLHFIDRC